MADGAKGSPCALRRCVLATSEPPVLDGGGRGAVSCISGVEHLVPLRRESLTRRVMSRLRTNGLTASTDPSALERLQTVFAGLYTPRRLAIALVVSLLLFALAVNASWRISPDSSLYMTLGRSLAEGQGYTCNGEPAGLVPPGYPALLAAVRWCFGESFLALRIVHAAMGWLCGVLVFVTLRRLFGDDLAFAVFLLFCVSHSLFHRSTYFLSDVPFTLVVWLALWTAVRAVTATRGVWLWTVAAAVTVALCPAVRINGLAVLPAVLVYLAWHWRREGLKGWLRVGVVALPFAAPMVVLVINELVMPADQLTYFRAAFTSRDPGYFVTAYLWNLLWYPRAIMESVMGFIAPESLLAATYVFLVPLAVGGWICLRRGHVLLASLVVLQLAGLCLSTPGDRYVIPLLPAFYLWALVSLVAILGALQSRRPWLPRLTARHLIVAVCLALLVGQVGRNVKKTIISARRADVQGSERRKHRPRFAAGRHLAETLVTAAETPPIVLTSVPNEIHYLSRARTRFHETAVTGGRLPEMPDYILLPRDDEHLPAIRDAVAAEGRALEEMPMPKAASPLVLWRVVERLPDAR
jgi:Dolichyl-phosphate-mannose-protein mannosyltransferase